MSTNSPYPGVNVPDKIIVHHSAASAPTPQFVAINNWHKARGFPLSTLGFYVGYHYVIEKDGTIIQARALDEGGAHAKGQNFTSVGICLVGNFNTGLPTLEQIDALSLLMRHVMERYPVMNEGSIYPHRAFNNTSCYGSHLIDSWAKGVFSKAPEQPGYDVSTDEIG